MSRRFPLFPTNCLSPQDLAFQADASWMPSYSQSGTVLAAQEARPHSPGERLLLCFRRRRSIVPGEESTKEPQLDLDPRSSSGSYLL